jgi:hypothetical protein
MRQTFKVMDMKVYSGTCVNIVLLKYEKPQQNTSNIITNQKIQIHTMVDVVCPC